MTKVDAFGVASKAVHCAVLGPKNSVIVAPLKPWLHIPAEMAFALQVKMMPAQIVPDGLLLGPILQLLPLEGMQPGGPLTAF